MVGTNRAAGTHQHQAAAATVGIVFSLVSLPVHFLLNHEQSVDLAAVMVAFIGAIYIGFALQRGTVRQILIEGSVATLFLGAAFAGLWWSPWVIPAAYVAHGIWDAVHHMERGALTAVPRWYPTFCAFYDVIYAAGLSLIWMYATPL